MCSLGSEKTARLCYVEFKQLIHIWSADFEEITGYPEKLQGDVITGL